ncbi:MAG TPA: metalloregulator ArsR/SmtB family transcription factor [Atribacterota bacterium]|nr:metalloregulator ArsR/SmtB family transcription factor [Atribacterota bacterium]
MMNEKLQNNSELLKVIAHPVRLCIVRRLIKNPCNVSEMYICLEKPQSTISQHLAKLRAARIIKGERTGTKICYRVINEEVKKIINVLFPDEN